MKKILLYWQTYIVFLAFFFGTCVFTGFANLVISKDHSHMTKIMLGFYFLTEIIAFWQIKKLSDFLDDLKFHKKKSELSKHYNRRTIKEKLSRSPALISFLASQIVWFGILATIVGVIIAFWPFLESGLSIENMRTHISEFFSGVAVAFITTALSFVLKIFLETGIYIIDFAISEINVKIGEQYEA
jgi:hypothetical protein